MTAETDRKIISAAHSRVIHLLVDYFESNTILYRFTGGFSGNLFGSRWKLQDLDIEVTLESLYELQKSFKNFITKPIHRYVDEEFEIWLLQLKIYGVDIDINAIEDFYIKPDFKIESDIENSVNAVFENRIIRTQSLEDIITYKTLLKRNNDLKELNNLKIHS